MKKQKLRADRQRWGVLFALPACILISIFVFVPIGCVFYFSLFDWKIPGDMEFIGLQGFVKVFNDKMFWNAISINLQFMFWGVILWTLVPLFAAACLYEIKKGAGFFRATYLFPTVLSVTIIGVVFKTLLGLNGPVNQALHAIGLGAMALDWFGSGTTAVPIITLVMTWAGFGSCMMIFLSAMSSIDKAIFECAMLDGASWWTRTFRITVPLIRRTFVVVVVMNIIAAFSGLYSFVFTMTNGGPGYDTTIMEYYIYTKAFRSFEFGYASTLSVVMFVIVGLISLVSMRVGNRDEKLPA